MGNISSANFKKSKDFQVWHNADIRPSYAIGGGLEVNRNGAEALELKNQIIKQAIDTYNNTKKPKAPPFKAKSYEWSLVVNLKKSSTMADLEKLSAHFKDKYGFQCYQIAIHRDEGHIDELGNKQINHHAHLEFVTLDERTGKNRFRGEFVTAKGLRAVQSEVAQILGMERGADKRLSGTKRIEPRAYAVMKEREKAERKADLEKINDLKAENAILEQIAESTKQERDSLKNENATLKDENAELKTENNFLNKEKEQLLTTKEVKETLETFRKQCIGKGLPKEFFRALSAEKQSPKQSTKQELELFFADLLRAYENEREEREKAETKCASLVAELESKNTQNRDIAPINSAALDTPKPTETTQSVEVAQQTEQKIDAPIKEQDSFKISADKDIKEILAESNISVAYDFNDENNAVYTHSSLYLPKAKEIRDKLENKGYYVQISANNLIEHQENRIALAFAKSKVAFDKICEFISSSWKSIYKTSEDKLDEIKEKLQQKTPKTASESDFEAKMRMIEQKTKETKEMPRTIEQMKEQVKKHAYNQRETPKRDLGISR